ncbi:hypothetical protein Plhal304r1_c061g0148721 [Plasmopara halstedii]
MNSLVVHHTSFPPPFSGLFVPSAPVLAESGSPNGGGRASDAAVVASTAAPDDDPMELPPVDTASPAPVDAHPTMAELLQKHGIGQVSKLPDGNLRDKVKTKEARLQLERTKINIIGGVFIFKKFDILAGKYFSDIANVDSNTKPHTILHRLFSIGCKPVYDTDTFREHDNWHELGDVARVLPLDHVSSAACSERLSL